MRKTFTENVRHEVHLSADEVTDAICKYLGVSVSASELFDAEDESPVSQFFKIVWYTQEAHEVE